ncbi:MAG: D-tyrosyl-tRNA(Tyr) deacylase [Paraglaciecola psychrophila]
MKALIQRVTGASVAVAGRKIATINGGLLVLLGVERGDGEGNTQKMAQRLCAYRVFADEQGKMNKSLIDVGGSVLLVSQFTLAADTKKGLRPGFSSAAPHAEAQQYYQLLGRLIEQQGIHLETGEFAADMAVSLVNDGPVTFLLES